MRMPGLIRRHARPVRLLAGLVTATTLALASSTVASADSGGIAQVSPAQGATLVGTAFTDQLHVSGASGTVTYAQQSGADSVTVSSSGEVSAAATLAVGTYTAAGTDSDTNGDSGTWTYTLSVLQQAPSSFSDTVVNVYQSEYAVSQQLGQSSGLPSVSAYQQEVSQLTPVALADLYNAVQQDPEWYQIPELMQTVAAGIPSSGAPSLSAPASTQSVSATLLNSAKSSVSAKSSASAKLSASAKSGGTPAPFTAGSCPPSPTDQSLFALQIVIDVTSGVYNVAAVDTAIPAFGEVAVVVGEIAATVMTGFQIAEDTLSFQQTLANDCSGNNQGAELDNIDNTTYQTYSLLTTIATTVTQLQSTTSTTQQGVQQVQSSLTTMQATLGQAIASDTQALQAAVGSDTQGLTSQLQTDLTGINQDLTTIEGDASTLSQAVGQSNTGTTTIESSLSSDLTKILNEVDTEAGGLTTLITQDNQQIMNTLNSNFSTEQTQYQAQLKRQIEQALAASGVTGNVPQVQFMLPASQGGYLNSTPVGVQEVVTDDLNALKGLGGKITPAALSDLNAANTALTAGQYLTAYSDYAACYVAIA